MAPAAVLKIDNKVPFFIREDPREPLLSDTDPNHCRQARVICEKLSIVATRYQRDQLGRMLHFQK